MKIDQPGEYRTSNGMLAVVVRIEGIKAHGHVRGMYDRTWWYSLTGQHALSSDYDIIEPVKLSSRQASDA